MKKILLILCLIRSLFATDSNNTFEKEKLKVAEEIFLFNHKYMGCFNLKTKKNFKETNIFIMKKVKNAKNKIALDDYIMKYLNYKKTIEIKCK